MKVMNKRMPKVQAVRMYGMSEAARLLEVPIRRLYLHVKVGKIEARKREVDGRLVISGQEIMRYWHSYNA